MTICPVVQARIESLPSIFGVVSPFMPRSRMKPRMTPSSVLTQTMKTSAAGECEIQLLVPESL